jgi:hypothetical protein
MPRWINFSLLVQQSADLHILENLRRGSREINELEDTALITEAARELGGYYSPDNFVPAIQSLTLSLLIT